jgi:hypothetical protein
MSEIHIFKISRGYRKVTIWHGNKKTGERYGVSTSRAIAGLTRQQRYENVKRCLGEYKIKCPPYSEHEPKRGR